MVDRVHTTAKVKGPVYEGIMWAGLAISIIFVTFRLWVRRKTLNRFFNDDYLVLLGTGCYLLTIILQQTQLGHIYELFAVEAGTLLPNFPWMQGQSALLHHSIAFNTLFYSGLWSVKLSFMLFFRRLEGGVTLFRYWWWVVLIISIGSWIACIADIQWYCLAYKVETNFSRYMECGLPEKVSFQQTTFKVNCALDVLTDCLILTVPIAILWSVRISLQRKLVLIGLFSMTVLIMAISIIRVTVVSSKNVPSDFTWLYMWSNVELIVALIVSSLASFRSLYVSSQPKPSTSRETNIFKRSLPRTRHILLSEGDYGSDTTKLGSKTGNQSLRKDSSHSSEPINTTVALDDWAPEQH